MAKCNWLLSTCSFAAVVAALPASALAADPFTAPVEQLPAVSTFNGKAAMFTGAVGGDFTLGANGSLAVPLSTQWGGQIDGLLGTAGGGAFYGIGGHLFRRDPAVGLLGAYASYVGWSAVTTTSVPTPGGAFMDFAGAQVGKIGIEGEAYLDRFSLEGIAAYQFGTFSGFAGKGTLAYYPTDNLRLDLSVSELQGRGLLFAAGGEWAPAGTGFTVFGDAGVGANSAWHALGGIRVYFGGEEKSLIRRHREDDPENLLPDDLYRASGAAYCPAGETSDGSFCVGPG